jgi:hypothetical protein
MFVTKKLTSTNQQRLLISVVAYTVMMKKITLDPPQVKPEVIDPRKVEAYFLEVNHLRFDLWGVKGDLFHHYSIRNNTYQ